MLMWEVFDKILNESLACKHYCGLQGNVTKTLVGIQFQIA